MDETTLVQNEKISPSYLNKLTIKVGILIGGFILLGVTFYSGMIVSRSLNSPSPINSISSQLSKDSQIDLEPTEQPLYQSPITSTIGQDIRIYPSQENHFSFYIYPSDSTEKCFYGIVDKLGYGFDVSGVLGTDKISCSDNQGSLASSFITWVDGDRFVMNEKDGEINIVNVGKFELETYNYDSVEYTFVGVSRTVKYWLFRKISQGKSASYVLFDRDNKIVLDNISFDSNDRGVLYDEVNDGFLFISRTYTGEMVSVKFDFLSLSDLSLRTILTTEPVVAPGRGCYSEYLLSQPGEIILSPGCLTVGNNHIGSDGNIHIKL